jgi:hypothetical protein
MVKESESNFGTLKSFSQSADEANFLARFCCCIVFPDARSLRQLSAVWRPRKQAKGSGGVERGPHKSSRLAAAGLLVFCISFMYNQYLSDVLNNHNIAVYE